MASKLPTQVLRGSLRSSPGPSGLGGFSLPCRKIVLEYNDQWPSSKGAMDFARKGKLTQIAQQWPNVEVVLQEKPNKHPMLRAFYGECIMIFSTGYKVDFD
jgi:large subunit ribosomal protein L43